MKASRPPTAPRALWNGVIAFGLVAIPVRLIPASRDRAGLALHLLHAKDEGRVHNKRVCEIDGADVPWSEVVRGYEYERGKYAVVTEEELEKLRPEATQTVEILQFADIDEIDPMLCDRPYFLAPETRGKRAYALLRDTLAASGKVGIAKIVLRTREHLAMLKPSGDVLILVLLRFADEMIDARSLDLPGRAEKASEAEKKAARTLLDAMTRSFDIAEFRDTHHDELERLLAKRARGQRVAREPAARPATNVIDLASVLERSLAAARGRARPGAPTKARKPQRHAHGARSVA
jgi:DNA end-binding protein Ku